ncbi:MAG: hypothetical protein LAP13_10340 [Acidobacteriia bacterium]|nr:hypothetical protein [Terriglobia bacterium]
MQVRRTWLFLMAFFLAIFPLLRGQDQAAPGFEWGGFQVQGAASAGYRFTDVKGYQPMFLELYDLRKGPRLTDFNMFGHNEGTNPFADNFSLTLSDLGGDPFPSAQLTLSKSKLYDLRVNWRQAYFYWNQNDNVILPTLGIMGLTNNHDWGTVRKMGSVDLTLHATNNLRFNFQYYRTSFSGPTFTTFSPDFLDSPASWGAFARANAYYLYAPTFNHTNRFTGGLDYTLRNWNFHYNLGYQAYTGNMTFNNVTSPQRSINTGTPSTASQLLNNVSWSAFRELKTPVSEFSYTGKPSSRLEMRGSYIFYRYRGPASFDQSFDGTNPAAYTVTQSGRANVTEPNNILEQGFTYYVNKWWNLDLDYRYSRFTTSTDGVFTSLLNGTTAATEQPSNAWKFGLHQLDFNMMFTPKPNLVIRPGVTFFKSDVEALEDGVADGARTLRTKSVEPALSVLYRPSSRFSVRGEIHSFNNGASFTAITPHTDLTGRVVGSLRLTNKFSLDDEVYLVSQRLLATDFHGKVQSNSTLLTYTLNDHYSIFGGFTYDNEFASGDVQYARGTPPLSGSIRDQALNRVWQGGLEAKPCKYFGIRFTGNFDRSTGLGQESGINPVYGPMTWPLATGTAYFDFPKAGRLSVDLQRTYYIQQIITGNNFSANMLMIRWTRSF